MIPCSRSLPVSVLNDRESKDAVSGLCFTIVRRTLDNTSL